jgi:hypothetical protein
MEKYGYKNISNMDDFQKHSQNNGNHEFPYNSGKHVTHQGFINWGDQNNWGAPGQSRYSVKTVEDLLGAADKVSTTTS